MKNKILFTSILIFGIILRTFYLFYSCQYTTPDIARIGLILGLNQLTLSLLELAFSILFIISTYFVGKKLFGMTGGLVSMLLVSIGPSSLIKTSVYPSVVYNITLLVGNLFFIIILKNYNIKRVCIFMGILLLTFSAMIKMARPFSDIVSILVNNTGDIISLGLNKLFEINNIFNLSTSLFLLYLVSFFYLFWQINKKIFESRYGLFLIFVIICNALILRIQITPKLDIHPAVLLYSAFPYILTFCIIKISERYNVRLFLIAGLIAVLQFSECALGIISSRRENVGRYNALNNLRTKLKSMNIGYINASPDLAIVINFLYKKDIYINPALVLSIEQYKKLIKNLMYIDIDYKKIIIDEFIILYSFTQPNSARKDIPPNKWMAVSNYNNKDTNLAFDRDNDTRWTTHQCQTPGMYYLLDLGEKRFIDKIVVYLDSDNEDRPAGLKIETSVDGIDWKQIVLLEDNEDIILWSGMMIIWDNDAGRQEYCFEAIKTRFIKLIQLEYKDSKYWSIRELFVYTPIVE